MTAGKLNLASEHTDVTIDIINIGLDQSRPKFSFFNSVYRRYTNFSMDSRSLLINGVTNFGGKFNLKFEEMGDLVGDIYLDILLPAPTTLFNVMPTSYANWTNSVGFALIESVKLKVGNATVDEQDGVWFDIQNELTDPSRKLWPLVGKVDDTSKLKFFQTNSTRYLVPLKFSFCKTPGLALPIFMTGTNKTQFDIEIKFRNLNNLLLHDGDNNNIKSNVNITSVQAYATYYTLENYEQERIKSYKRLTRNGKRKIDNFGKLIHLIETVEQRSNLGSTFTIADLRGSIKELFWILQPDERLSSTDPLINDNFSLSRLTGNDFFNYSSTSVNNNSRDPFTSLKIKFSNEDLEEKPPTHFRYYLPYKHHSNVPSSYVYCLPLCLHPEDYQPSGTINLQNTSSNISFTFFNVPSGFKVKLYATSYRFLEMDTKYASVKPIESKRDDKILQDSLKITEYQDTESISSQILESRAQAEKSAQEAIKIASQTSTEARSDQLASLINNFNQQISLQNNQIIQLRENIIQSNQAVNTLTQSVSNIGDAVNSKTSGGRKKIKAKGIDGVVRDRATERL